MLRLFTLIAALLSPSVILAKSDTAPPPAADNTRPRLLLFTGTWDAASTELLDRTLPDRRLQTFLAEKIAVSRHDVITLTDLTRAHHIRSVPTLILLRPDGTELDRWTGPQKSSAFLRDLKDAIAGKTSLTKRRASLDADDLKDHLALAEDLVADGRFSAALEEYLHVFHQLDDRVAKKKRPLLTGPYDFAIYDALGQLAKLHSPATDALRRRRTVSLAAVISSPDREWYEALRVAQIDRLLSQSHATLAFFQQLPPASKARERLRFDVFKILLARQAWRDAADLLTVAELIELRGKRIEPSTTLTLAARTLAPFQAGEILTTYRHRRLKEWSGYLEAYASREDRESARTLALFILDHDKDAVAPAYLTAAVHRALGLNADAFLRSLAIASLPAPAPALAALPTNVPEPPPLPENEDPDLVELSPFLVSEKARGALPFTGRWRRTTFGQRLKSPITVRTVAPQISDRSLHPGDRIHAIDGRAVTTFTQEDLIRLWSDGDAGDTVTLIIQGYYLDDALYREITVKRIAPPKPVAR